MKAYVEFDGEVLIVKKDGILTLPEFNGNAEFKREYGFPVKKVADITDTVSFFDVVSQTKSGKDWILKDKILLMENAERELKEAIMLSYQRVIVCAVILNKGKYLLVKPKAGLAKGKWILPGGFLRYCENPEKGCAREAREEIGAFIKIKKLLGVHETHTRNEYDYITIAYIAKMVSKAKPKGEIGQMGWFNKKEGLKICCKTGTTKKILKALNF